MRESETDQDDRFKSLNIKNHKKKTRAINVKQSIEQVHSTYKSLKSMYLRFLCDDDDNKRENSSDLVIVS